MNRAHAAGAALSLVLAAGACTGSDAAAIELVRVTSGEVTQTVAAPATVEPADRRTVVAAAPGTIAELFVASGDEVSAGDPLLRIDSPGVESAIGQAQAGLDAAGALAGIGAGADLSLLIRPLRTQVEDVVPPILDVAEDQARAVADDDRRDALLAQIAAARASYVDVVAELATAERQATAAARRAGASQRAAAEAQRRQAEAALSAAEQRQGALTLTAPIGGVVELAHDGEVGTGGIADGAELPSGLGGLLGGTGAAAGTVAVGAEVAPGQPLLTIYDLSGFHVRATVDEVDAILVAAGQPTTVLIEAYPDRGFAARVARVAVGPQQGTAGGVVYPVTIRFQDDLDDVTLRVGMSASAEITVERVDADLVVPARALLRRGDRDVVLVAREEDGRSIVREVGVDVVASGEERIAVVVDAGELTLEDRVVAGGFEDLEDGDALPDGSG